jgi:hypothetical protein
MQRPLPCLPTGETGGQRPRKVCRWPKAACSAATTASKAPWTPVMRPTTGQSQPSRSSRSPEREQLPRLSPIGMGLDFVQTRGCPVLMSRHLGNCWIGLEYQTMGPPAQNTSVPEPRARVPLSGTVQNGLGDAWPPHLFTIRAIPRLMPPSADAWLVRSLSSPFQRCNGRGCPPPSAGECTGG